MADGHSPCWRTQRDCVYYASKKTHSDSETDEEKYEQMEAIRKHKREKPKTTPAQKQSQEAEETTGSDYIQSGTEEAEETTGSDYIQSGIDIDHFSDRTNRNDNTSADFAGKELGSYEHYWQLMETGIISVPNCADIKLMENYFIVVVDNRIIKKCRVSEETIDSMRLEGAGRMCCIKKSTRIAVIQTPSFISCLETHPQLSVVYRIKTNGQYTSICHLNTYTKYEKGLPNPMHVFATVQTKRRVDTGHFAECIMQVKPICDKHQDRNPVYTEETSEMQLPQVSKICSLTSVWRGGVHLIVGCYDSVACIRVTDKYTLWKTPLEHSATDVTFMDPNILVCVQDENRIAAIEYTTGNEVIKNIFDSTDDKTVSPHRLSVCGDTVLMKGYSNDKWRMLTISEHTQKHERASVKKEHTILK